MSAPKSASTTPAATRWARSSTCGIWSTWWSRAPSRRSATSPPPTPEPRSRWLDRPPCFDLTQTARLVIQPFLALQDEERLEDLRVVVLPKDVLTGLEVVNGLLGVARVDREGLAKDRDVGVV